MKQLFLMISAFFVIGFLPSCHKDSLNPDPSMRAYTASTPENRADVVTNQPGVTALPDDVSAQTFEHWNFCNTELFVRKTVRPDNRYIYAYNSFGVVAYDGAASAFPPELMNSANAQFVNGAKVIWATMTVPEAGMYIVERYENLIILLDGQGNIICRGTRL